MALESVLETHGREKLLNAIVYFCQNTKHCHTLKLFKLLNFFDFEHYRATGRGVTGLQYNAWPKGPAPAQLWRELEAPLPDMLAAVAVFPVKDDITDKTLRRDIKPKRKFDANQFTRRELKIMERLAFIFAETKGEDMTEVSHLKNLPWRRVYDNGKGNGRVIPYALALDAEPLMDDMPTIAKDEYEYRKEIFGALEQGDGGGI